MRLGLLPATRRWQEVVAMLKAGDLSIPAFAEACATAANESLGNAANDKIFQEVFRLLCNIPRAAKENDFKVALEKLGIPVGQNPTLEDIACAIPKSLDQYVRDNGIKRTDLGEMARHAMLSSLLDQAREAAVTLWNPNPNGNLSPDDTRHALASYAAPEKFASLNRHFFTSLTERMLNYFIQRELPKHVSPNGAFKSVADLTAFDRALETHCRETSMILHAFSKDWYGKSYAEGKDIDVGSARGFIYVATKKLGNEMDKRRNPDV